MIGDDKDVVVTFHHKAQLHVSDEQSAAIACCLEPDSKRVTDVIAALHRFVARENAMSALPKGDHRRRDLKALKALVAALNGINTNILFRLARHGVKISAETAYLVQVAAEELECEVSPQKAGNRPKTSRAIMLLDLANIYEQVKKKPGKIITATIHDKDKAEGEPTGEFFAFLRAAVAPVPELAQLEDYALAQAMKRAGDS